MPPVEDQGQHEVTPRMARHREVDKDDDVVRDIIVDTTCDERIIMVKDILGVVLPTVEKKIGTS